MSKSFSYFSILSLGLAIYLVSVTFRYFTKENYAKAAFKFPEYMERFVKQQKIRFFGFRIVLWLTPFYLLIVPLAIFFYSRDAFIVGTVCMILIAVISFQEYRISKWILDYLQTNQPKTDNSQVIHDKVKKN